MRDLRFFPVDIKENFTNIMIYENKVAITSSVKESFGLIIESQELATGLKYIWQIVWKASLSI